MPGSTKTILLIEDEALIALQEAKQLERAGYRVIHSLTGEKGVEIVNENPAEISLILMDIDLGKGLDGTEAARQILKTNDIPILFLSSHTETDIVHKTEEITNYGYVVKSSSFTVLDASIKMAFRLFAAKRQLDLNNMEIESKNEALQAGLADLQRTHDELVLSESKFSKAFQLNPDSINLNRLSDGVYVDINEGFTQTMGYAREEVIGRSSLPEDLGIWVHARDRERLIRGLQEKGEVANLEAEFKKKDGSTTIGLMSARIIEIRGEKCIISITRDIGSWISTQNELRATKAILNSILDSQKDIYIVSIDRDFNCVFANNAYKDIKRNHLGIEIQIGKSLLENLEGDFFLKDYVSHYRRALAGESFRVIETYESINMIIESQYSPILSESGEITGATSFSTDISERIRMEAALRKSEERFRLAMDATSDGVWDRDCLTGQVYYSPAYFRMLGYCKDDIRYVATDWTSLIHPDDRELVLRKNKECEANLCPGFDIEFRLETKSKDWKWIRSRGHAVGRDGGGRATRIIGTHVDVTDRKVTENDLRLKSVLLDNAGDAIQILDLDGEILYVNDAVCHNTGYSRAELVGRNITVLDTPVAKLASKTILGDVVRQGSKKFVTEQIRKDGSIYPIDVNCVLEPSEKKHIISIVRDITDQRKNEDSLRRSEERLSRILSNSSELICEVDSQSRFTFVSSSCKKNLGYKPEALLGLFARDLLHPDDYEKAISRHDTIRSNIDSSIDIWRFRNAQGAYRLFECHSTVFAAQDGSIMTVVVSHDITEQRERELEILRLLDEKDSILKEVHHRVKNSINTVRSLIALERTVLTDPKAISASDDTLSRINSMIALYEQLSISSTFSHVSLDHFLKVLIERTIETFPSSESIRIERRIDDFELDASRAQTLGIIINELLTNIMKYAFAAQDDKTISIFSKTIGDTVSVSVRDNGSGMPQSIDFDHSPGMGLMLVRELTKQIFGRIRIERNHGTEVILEFEK